MGNQMEKMMDNGLEIGIIQVSGDWNIGNRALSRTDALNPKP